MKRPNKYPYTRSKLEEIKIYFNYSDKSIPYVYLEDTLTRIFK